MKQKISKSRIHRIALLCLLPLFSACGAAPANSGHNVAHQPSGSVYTAVHPTDKEADISLRIVSQLQQHHFNRVALNDDFSHKLLHQYLDDLDPSHSVLLASDVQRFRRQYGDKLDDAVQDGNLKPAFDIYNTFQARRDSDLARMRSQLSHGTKSLDLDTHQSLLVKRDNAPWPADQAAMRALWRKRLDNDVINLKLDDQSDKKIQSTLEKRFKSQRNRLAQAESRDAFDAYMGAYTRSYDPHTAYFPPSQSQSFDIQMRLSLEGIGAVLQNKDNYVEIVRLVPGGPAAKSHHLHPSDRIVAVGQGKQGSLTDVVGMRLDEVVQLIRGQKGSTVRLKIIPASAGQHHQTRTIKLVREKVTLKDQAAQKHVISLQRDGKTYHIGIITLPTFYVDFKGMQAGDANYRSATRDVKKLLQQLKKQGVDGVVMDLRNNGGGALEEATKMTGLFIKTGPVVQIKDANDRVSVLGDHDSSVTYKGPLAIVVNRLSASASEIFTGAIKDYGRGVIVGSNTFGKGSVQSLMPLGRGQLKLTEAMFYRVNGASTQSKGVKPDIAYPPIYNHKKIGEDALSNALAWNQIPAVDHPHSSAIENLLPTLRKEHNQRAAHDADFQYLKQQLALIRQRQNRKTASLNLAKRRSEQKAFNHKRLALANRHRKATGKKPFKTIDRLNTSNESNMAKGMPHNDTADDDNDGKKDPYLRESGQILVDMLQHQTHY